MLVAPITEVCLENLQTGTPDSWKVSDFR